MFSPVVWRVPLTGRERRAARACDPTGTSHGPGPLAAKTVRICSATPRVRPLATPTSGASVIRLLHGRPFPTRPLQPVAFLQPMRPEGDEDARGRPPPRATPG